MVEILRGCIRDSMLWVQAIKIREYTVSAPIEHHSWIERHEAQIRYTMVIFWQFLSKITIFLDVKIAKMTTVSSRKIVKFNRTPAFYRRGFGKLRFTYHFHKMQFTNLSKLKKTCQNFQNKKFKFQKCKVFQNRGRVSTWSEKSHTASINDLYIYQWFIHYYETPDLQF